MNRLLLLAASLGAAGTAAIGATFLFAPTFALDKFDHAADRLPLVMGGRYLFLAGILALALYWRDLRLLTALMIGFAGLAFVDALIYLGPEAEEAQVSALPHLTLGVICLGAATLFHRLRGT